MKGDKIWVLYREDEDVGSIPDMWWHSKPPLQELFKYLNVSMDSGSEDNIVGVVKIFTGATATVWSTEHYLQEITPGKFNK